MATRGWLTWAVGGLAVVLVVGGAGFFGFAPAIVESNMNRIEETELPEVGAEARALHETLFVADLHSDTLLWQRDLLQRGSRGHLDLPG